jgi:type II secretory pathway pseudopilin PulG
MISDKSGRIIRNQRGFTLIEILAALAIMILIGGSVSMATIQILKQSTRNGDFTTVSQNTMNAIHWISRDAEMAQTLTTNGTTGFPLTLAWTDWGSSAYQVVYTIQSGKLKRSYSVNGGGAVQTDVAEFINSTSVNTTCVSASRILTLKVTATIGQGAHTVSVTNMREIFMRSSP